ncbi:hypothetical protein LEN26_006562 [Aphanomyces euteiches]|nr:hypothetical protein AeMF1_015623 [Aphanomyces euteiches]KAH9135123.1 hypothetical protein LEN26_006562 [Aphanomyces euteiches]KAH9194985.1 hypothetical protein AeNC1_003018 [Aphanomyces euteiches]
MFGSTTTGFGAPAAQPASTGFNFGASAGKPAATTGGFSFGGTSSTQPSASTAPSTGFGFGGSTPAAQPTAAGGGFSFGGTATQPTTSAFGSTQPQAALTGFSFGGSSAPTTATNTTGGGGFSFGSTQPAAGTAPGAFSFGGATPAPAAGSTGFSFGGTGTGATSTTNTAFSFGKPTTGTTTAPGAFSFSAPATGTAGSSFGSGFGATANKSTFGSFGQTQAPSTGFGTASAFPVGTTSSLNAAEFAAANSPLESLQGIKMAYTDPFQSRFKHMFYNAVDPSLKHLYTRPPHIGEKLWIQAQRDNPDPTNCVPAAVLGFKELSTRIKLQQEEAQKFHGYAKDLVKQVEEMKVSSRHTDVKLAQCRQQHVALCHRLVQLMRKLEVFKQLRKPLHVDELRLAAMLKQIQSMLDNPTQFKAHMHELITLQALQEAKPHHRPDAQLTEEDMATVFRLLDKQREGLEHLTKILNQDIRDVQIMQKALEDDE